LLNGRSPAPLETALSAAGGESGLWLPLLGLEALRLLRWTVGESGVVGDIFCFLPWQGNRH